MSIKAVYSTNQNVSDAVTDIKNQLEGFNVEMLLFFASSIFEPAPISKQLHEAFSSSLIFGCSSAGEIADGKMLKNSIAAMAFSPDSISGAKVEILENINEDGNIKKAFTSFEEYFNEPMSEMDFNKYIGIVLIDGLSKAEEKIMDRIGDKTNIMFIGGSAGDDLKFEKTYVYLNGLAYTNAALLALIKPTNGFEIIKTQSFKPAAQKLIATKVNEEGREVLEFNNKPAADAYAEALGIVSEKAPEYFMSNPVGLVSDDEIFVRSPQQIIDQKMIFYCNILEGMEVSLLQSTDIISDTKSALENKKQSLGNISGIINFNCILRTLELEQKCLTEQYGKLFSDIPTIGFSTYGEEYIGHINQTATMIVFK